jgi:hypothetical protein
LIKFNILDIAYGFQPIVTSTNLGTVEWFGLEASTWLFF